MLAYAGKHKTAINNTTKFMLIKLKFLETLKMSTRISTLQVRTAVRWWHKGY